MEPIITINEYPIGWEWLDKVPLEDFTWLIESSEEEYMNQLTDIKLICNEL